MQYLFKYFKIRNWVRGKGVFALCLPMVIGPLFVETVSGKNKETNNGTIVLTDLSLSAENSRKKAIELFVQSESLSQNGDYISAYELLERAFILESSNFQIKFALVKNYRAAQRMEKVIELLEQWSGVSDDKFERAVWLTNLGSIWEELQDKKRAKDYYKKSLTMYESDVTRDALDKLKAKEVHGSKGEIENILFAGQIDSKNIRELIESLNKAISNSPTRIDLYISSNGGFIDEAILAYNYIRSLPVKVRTINFNKVQSSANTLFCAGEERSMVENSHFMFHRITYRSLRSGSSLDDITINNIQSPSLTEKANQRILQGCMPSLSEKNLESYFDQGKVLSSIEAKKIGYVESVSIPNFKLHDISVVPKPK